MKRKDIILEAFYLSVTLLCVVFIVNWFRVELKEDENRLVRFEDRNDIINQKLQEMESQKEYSDKKATYREVEMMFKY